MTSDSVLDAAWAVANAERRFNEAALDLTEAYVAGHICLVWATCSYESARDQARDALLEAKGMRPWGR